MITARNKTPNIHHKWNVKGLLIGNGWIAPKEQSMAYLEYAYKAELVKRDSDMGRAIEQQQLVCKAEIADTANEMRVSYDTCEEILQQILRRTVKADRCINMYDIRLDDTYPSCGMNWPPDLKHITPYLRRQDVVNALHVNHEKMTGWRECNGGVSRSFRAKHSKPAIEILPQILTEIPVLLFSGEKDLICNHVGTEELIHNMEWNGGKGFELTPGTWAPRRDWTFEGTPAGIYQEARNLTYVLFYNSSHMVPFDYPRRTRDMLDRFMGVDIASIGGKPTDSRIDGEKGLETSVGGHPNSTAAEIKEQERLQAERWSAYYRSGSIALVVVAILAVAFGWYVWQDRRRRAGYSGLNDSSSRLMAESTMRRDVEAADFDENELDNIPMDRDREARYSLGGISDDEDEDGGHRKEGGLNGHVNRR